VSISAVAVRRLGVHDIEELTMSTITTSVPRTESTVDRRVLVRGTVFAAVAALAVNLVVFLLGDAGAPVRVITGWAPDGTDLRYVDVALATVSLLVVGTLVLGLLERLRADGLRVWSAIAVGFAVLSILPVLRLDIDAGSKLTLGVMHLVVGVAAVSGQRLARR
jgi:hypothetical protein